MAGEFAALVMATSAFGAALKKLEIDDPIIVRLSHEDGQRLLATCAAQLTAQEAIAFSASDHRQSRVVWTLIAGVRFEWPVLPGDVA